MSGMETVRCNECGLALNEPENVPLEARTPCPRCGSRARLYSRMLTATVSPVATLATAVATGAAAMYAAAKILVRPPSPEPGYHLPQDPADVLGGGIAFGIGAAAFFVTVREVGRIWREGIFKREDIFKL
jgi:phage FluMu protein Com